MKAQNLLKLKQSSQFAKLVPDFVVIRGREDLKVQTFDKEKVYAVRSSCVVEDGMKSSHAGEFKTLLKVKASELTEAVQCVEESFGEHKGRIIIQEMVSSELSGVIFTANPVGMLNEVVIVVGKGTGDKVVEDRVETSTYYYHIDDRICCYDGENLLSDVQVRELTELALKIREFFGFEADIEFAIADDRFFLLQVRPITTLAYGSSTIVLDNSNIVESYPGISLPLTQDFVREIYYRVFQTLVWRLTKNMAMVHEMDGHLQNMVAVVNGRIYYRIDNWYNILGLLPFSGRIMRIWQQMMGITNKSIDHNFRAGWKTKLAVLKSFLYLLFTSERKMEELHRYFSHRLEEYRSRIEWAKSTRELLNVYEAISKDLTEVWDITLVNDMYTFLFAALSGKKGKEQLASVRNLESMQPAILLNELVKIYRIHGDDIYFREKATEYIDRYGDRCPGELKLETKTYRTNPELLKEYVKKAGLQDLKAHETKARENFVRKRAKAGIYHRELSRMNRTRIFGLAREIMLKIGENFVEKEYLLKREDIFYLFYSELTENKDYKEVVRRRRQEYEDNKRLPDYSRLVFAGEIIHTKRSFASIQSSEQTGKGDVLYGTPTSSGVVRGEVLVLDFPDLEIDTSNKIIIAQTTDPGWVFLIRNCLGIITQRGSMLSHTAIITRELRKPSVVNVKDITKTVKTGDIVELNGSSGVVQVIRRGAGWRK